MGNRFGFRDLVLAVLLVVLIVSVWLAMKQYDRQWDQLEQIGVTLDDQAVELKRIRQALAQGIRVSDADDAHASTAGLAFPRRRAATQMDDYATGDWYIDAFGVAVGKLTPLVSSDVYQSVISNYVMESLASRDAVTLEWQPDLAESWHISDDGLTITVKLREQARFSDGQPVTADDVVFTYHWIMNPKVAAPRDRSYVSKIASVTKIDDLTVTFKLNETYFKGFEICAGMQVMAKHYYSQFTEDQFNELPGLLFGSGPYKLVVDPLSWKPGSGKIELMRNDKYWAATPAYDRIVFREITDETARLVTFRNGEIDRFGPQPEQYLRLKEDEQLQRDKVLYEYETITGGYRYVAWNQMREGKPTRFADRRVRRAMTLLTDRSDMARTLMVGLATPNSGPFHRLSKQADADIDPWPYDPQAARTLLGQAGFEDRDDNGVIESDTGEPFRFKLIYPASSVNYKQMALYLKDAYARAGIVLEPDPLEWTIMIQRINQREFDAMTLGWSGTIEGDPNQIFHSRAIGDGGDNYVHYQNADLDQLIDQARVTIDQDQRMALWRKVHRILHEDQPYTFLWTSRSVVFLDKRIHNVQRVKTGLNHSMHWFVPLGAQRWSK